MNVLIINCKKYLVYLKRKIVLLISWTLSKCLKRDNKMIYFESFLGRQYSDNPRAIYEYVKKEYPAYKCYWGMDKKHTSKFKNENLEAVPRFSVRWFYIVAKAKYWVNNSRFPIWLNKPNDTIYMQTWHGTPLKKLALDMDMSKSELLDAGTYHQDFIKETSRWDILISQNNYSTEIFKRCFAYTGEMLEIGYPRNDILINDNHQDRINKIKQKLNVPKDKKIILYVPTWRDTFKFNMLLDIDELAKKLGDEYHLLVRMHYLVAQDTDSNKKATWAEFQTDCSDYNDINELYLISDILITDYSSVFFDFSILNRPIIFYAPDIVEYRDELRGFYLDFEKDVPGEIVTQTKEVISLLKNGVKPSEQNSAFKAKYTALEDGEASKRAVERLFEKV